MNHLVDVVAGLYQCFQNVRTLLCLLKVEPCAADGDIMPVFYEVLDTLTKAQQTWAAPYQCNAIH